MTKTTRVIALCLVLACGSGGDGKTSAPWTTSFDSTGDTIVARTTGSFPNELERRLVLEQQIGEAEGNDTVTFGRIEHMAVTSDGHVFVLDAQGPTLKLFDSTGKLVRFVGRRGSGPGEFAQVTGLGVLPNENLALWDAANGRVNIYTVAGDFSTQWRVPVSGYFTVEGLHTDRTGSIVLRMPIIASKEISALGGSIGFVRFESSGVVRDTVRVPAWIAPPPSLRAMSERSVSMRFLPFTPRLTFTWSRSGALLSGPGTPYAVHLTNGPNRPLRIEREWTPVRVLPEEADDIRADLTWAMRGVDPNWNWSGPNLPEAKPAYERLQSSEDARIWVKVYATAERTEPEDPPPPQPGQPPRPVQRYAEPNVYDVFDPGGSFLGRVRGDRSQRFMRMRGDRVWGVLTDSSGVAYVARWRVEPPFQPPMGSS